MLRPAFQPPRGARARLAATREATAISIGLSVPALALLGVLSGDAAHLIDCEAYR